MPPEWGLSGSCKTHTLCEEGSQAEKTTAFQGEDYTRSDLFSLGKIPLPDSRAFLMELEFPNFQQLRLQA